MFNDNDGPSPGSHVVPLNELTAAEINVLDPFRFVFTSYVFFKTEILRDDPPSKAPVPEWVTGKTVAGIK